MAYITKGIGGFYYVKTPDGIVECKARGIFRKRGITPVAGDNVTLSADGTMIDEILPRKNVFIRPPIANLDILFIVTSTTQPVPSTLVLDQLAAAAIYKDVQPVLVVTKADLAAADMLRTAYTGSGIPLVQLNYKTGEGDTSKAVTVSAVKLADTGVFSMTEGTVAELTFTVKADAATGASAGFTLEKVAVCDKTFVNDAVKVQTGAAPKVTVGSAVVLGDVNGDGKVNNVDAALVYAYHNKKLTLTEDQLAAADVNGDGKVNNVDAALIYAYHNKKLTKFPAA